MASEFRPSLKTSILDLLFNLSQAYTPSFTTSVVTMCGQYIQIILLNISLNSATLFDEPSVLSDILTYTFRPFTDPWEFFSSYELPSILMPCILSALKVLMLIVLLLGVFNPRVLPEQSNFTTLISAVLYYQSTILLIPTLSSYSTYIRFAWSTVGLFRL